MNFPNITWYARPDLSGQVWAAEYDKQQLLVCRAADTPRTFTNQAENSFDSLVNGTIVGSHSTPRQAMDACAQSIKERVR